MRTLLVYILLVATLLPTVSQWGTIAYYHANKAYIARVLCENRDRPELHCDGHCFLAKRLKARQDKQDQETTERVQRIPTLQLFCQSQVPFAFGASVTDLPLVSLPKYLLQSYAAPLDGLLQPPQA
ncbi:hypothetical protein DYU11_06485 [Fibrisoma montanum]|uniref:Uncharacterized protein n=1 Tax=Fibrisoma montanum TaxID=2305895 RepID=A0A418MDU8_9BACT|nr:hypothetical protein [Fibrisoma montanum]RIV24962.1 hypothetical protein DYU11_06485 [Fibrisoma montanum]